MGIYFPLYDALAADLAAGPAGGQAPLVAGALARTAAVLCTSPLELVRTRMQVGSPGGSTGSTMSSALRSRMKRGSGTAGMSHRSPVARAAAALPAYAPGASARMRAHALAFSLSISLLTALNIGGKLRLCEPDVRGLHRVRLEEGQCTCACTSISYDRAMLMWCKQPLHRQRCIWRSQPQRALLPRVPARDRRLLGCRACGRTFRQRHPRA